MKKRDSNPSKSSVLTKIRRKQLANNPNPDRDVDYMRKMWGTESLVTDYGDFTKKPQKKVIQEIMNDDSKDFLQD